MRSRRRILGVLLTTLLLAIVAAPAAADVGDRQGIDEFDSGVVADFEGDLELFCPDYPVGECLLILPEISGPVCTDLAPIVEYEVKLGPGVEADQVDIILIAPDADTEYPFPDMPLTGEFLWPGATIEDDEIVWPGWVLGEDGWFVQDPAALVFPSTGVDVRFEVGAISATVAAPDLEEDECAPDAEVAEVVLEREPPEAPAVLGVTLARTGLNAALLSGIGLMLGLVGILLVRSRRRTPDGA